MKLGINGFITRIRKHYDRVIAFAVLLGLISTIILLFVQVGLMRQRQIDFDGWMDGLRPLNERVAEVGDEAFLEIMHAIAHPPQLAGGEEREHWTFVPESRFSCSECGHPVPVEAEECPFCGAPVTPPEVITLDHDGDGMPTLWENKYGLDPNDPRDADEDLDGDGFTNLEEYLYGTDPTDPDSYPPLIDWLVVDRIEGREFGLQFRSRVRTPTGHRFGINYRLPDGETRTDFVELGESVSGFVLETYEERMVPAEPPAMGRVDRSELTIRSPRGDQIVLVMDRAVRHLELRAFLRVDRDAPQHQMDAQVRRDDTFSLDGIEYKVIDIDEDARRVVIQSLPAGETYTVTDEIRAVPVAEDTNVPVAPNTNGGDDR